MSPARLLPDRPVLVAPGAFGATLRATQVAGAVGRGLERAGLRPPDLCPLADGGPGTAEVLLTALGGETHDGFALLEEGGTGLVEADAAGRFTGERLARALDAGAAVVLVAARAEAATGDVLEVLADRGGVGGARLVVLVDRPPAPPAPSSPPPPPPPDARTQGLASLVPTRDLTPSHAGRPEGKTAEDTGRLAAALRETYGAVLERGGPWVLGALGFDARMHGARAVLTGEEHLGPASLDGLVGEVGRRARQSGVPLHAVTAQDDLDPFAKRMIDLQVVLEAGDAAGLEAAAEDLGRELADGRA